MEFVERLGVEDDDVVERWLVRAPGAELPHVAWLLYEYDPSELAATEQATRAWVGAIHPRVCAIHRIAWHGERLLVETDDDRGPRFVDAAQQLTDPVERERWAIAQIIAVADALATMRQRDRAFVHRQLSSSSLFVDVAGHAKLRAPIIHVEAGPRPNRVGQSRMRGVPAYLAPEQARGTRATPATDVFALAGVLYTALSGREPFAASSLIEVIHQIVSGEPPPLALHAPDLDRILARAFAKEPSSRIPDVGTFAGELWQCIPDAMDYDAVISDRVVAWRATAADAPRERVFETAPCRMKWDELGGTSSVRHCASCKTDVVHASSLAQVVPLVGRCVAYRGGD